MLIIGWKYLTQYCRVSKIDVDQGDVLFICIVQLVSLASKLSSFSLYQIKTSVSEWTSSFAAIALGYFNLIGPGMPLT